MVNKEDIRVILEDIIGGKTSSFVTDEKCGSRPGYKSPQQKLKEFLEQGGDRLEDLKSYRIDRSFGDYNPERYAPGMNARDEKDEGTYFHSPCGEMQDVQQKLQREIDYSDEECWSALRYNTDCFDFMNEHLYGKADHSDMYEYNYDTDERYSIPEMCDLLHGLIGKSPVVQENCVTYRYGPFPYDLKEGEIGSFDGFTSVSYNYTVAENFKKNNEDGGYGLGGWMKNNRKLMRIWTPEGTPCMAMDKVSVGTQDFQSEILLDKGQKFIVISNDDDFVDIMLYNDD